VGDFNTSFSLMNRYSKTKLDRETTEVTDVMIQINLTDIYRTFHPNTKEYTVSVAHGTFSKTDYILGHKASLNSYKKFEITACILRLPRVKAEFQQQKKITHEK
jgi:exonuclease III